ncbi:MAG: DUF4331 family protein [Saprospiraceae bacterium]
MKFLHKAQTYLLGALMLAGTLFSSDTLHPVTGRLQFISNDLAGVIAVDSTYFRSPDDPNTITIIATYVPLQLLHGGPNYYSFGKMCAFYIIHVDNDASVPCDEKKLFTGLPLIRKMKT